MKNNKLHHVIAKTEYMDALCSIVINSSYYSQKKVRISLRITENHTNKRLESFYIGFKGFAIQNSIISEMFLCMVNVMEYGIQHFWQTIHHQYFMFYKLFNMYNMVALDKMYGVCSCRKRTLDGELI